MWPRQGDRWGRNVAGQRDGAAPPTGGAGRQSRRPCRLIWDRGRPVGGRAVQPGRRSWRPCRSSWQMLIAAAQSPDPVLAPFRVPTSTSIPVVMTPPSAFPCNSYYDLAASIHIEPATCTSLALPARQGAFGLDSSPLIGRRFEELVQLGRESRL